MGWYENRQKEIDKIYHSLRKRNNEHHYTNILIFHPPLQYGSKPIQTLNLYKALNQSDTSIGSDMHQRRSPTTALLYLRNAPIIKYNNKEHHIIQNATQTIHIISKPIHKEHEIQKLIDVLDL